MEQTNINLINNDFLCYICKNHNIKKEDDFEFKFIYCERKEYYYFFIICPFCSNKIFYKKIDENANLPLNGINGINIKCPYKLCENYFF